jgi:hypothetical protein
MTTRTRTAGTALAATLITALAACGGGNSEAESPDAGVVTTDAPAATDPVTNTTAEPQPETESTDAPAATQPTTTAPTSTEPATTVPPTTEPAAREATAPLVGTTDLLVDGVTPFPDQDFLGPREPDRYHSYRLGTEIVFDVPEQFNLGQHRAGSIAWDLDLDRILFISRWGENEALDPDEWINELIDSDWEVTDTDWPDISGYAVRHLDVTPTTQRESIGGTLADGALGFGDGLTRRIWIIEQDDGQPVVIGTGISSDAWAEFVEDVVSSIELGPTIDDPRVGRAPLEYGSVFWSADAAASYRTLLFDDAVVTFPNATSGLAGGQALSIDVPGGFTGTSAPRVEIGAVGELVLTPPDDPTAEASERAGGEPADAAAFREHLASLADQGLISELRRVDTTATLLGQPTTALEFDVPGGAEVYPAVSAPDGWSGLTLYTFVPALTYRVWTADIGDQVAIVLAAADVANPTDLDQASNHAELVMAAFRPA